MCQFGDSSKILEELNLTKDEALIGWRNNIISNPFNNEEKFLKSLNKEYLYPKDWDAQGLGLKRENSLGIYNYYNYYNNNNYNNYNYNIQIKTLHYGKIFEYKEGYRSEFCKITYLVILDKDSKWFTDDKTIKFATHFNDTCESLAKEYHCDVLEFSKR